MLLSLDCETDLIAPGKQAPELACVAIWAESGASRLYGRREWLNAIAPLIRDPQVRITGHGIAFDMAVLGNEAPHLLPDIFAAYEADRIYCTEIRAKLIDIARGWRKFHPDKRGKLQKSTYNLEDLSLRDLNRQLDKDTWRLRYGELKHVPIHAWPEGAKIYPLEDTRAGFDLWQFQEQFGAFLRDQFRQTRSAFWIRLMSNWGIHTDPQGVWELAQRTQRDFDKIAEELKAAGLLRPDRQVKRRATGLLETEKGSRNVKAAGERLIAAYARQGKDYPRAPKGGPKLDEQACLDSGDPILALYAKATSLGNVLSKDVPELEKGVQVPIHSYFDPLKETGRTSSAGPNIQNVKRVPGIRECFVPRPGTVFIASDYGGLELCTLAQVCKTVLGYSTLADALNAGWDPHLMIASKILGADYQVLKEIRSGTSHPWFTSDDVDNARQTGKVANFGFPGGLGAATLVAYALMSYGVRMTEDQARDLKRIWLETWPEMRLYFNWINAQTSAPQPLICQLYSERYRGGPSYTAACNSYFQGLGSDIAKDAGWHIIKACYVLRESPLWGCRPVNFVHDEFILEAPERRAHEAAIELARIMMARARVWLPDVSIKCEPLIMSRWSKKAKPVWQDGRLVPWRPKVAA